MTSTAQDNSAQLMRRYREILSLRCQPWARETYPIKDQMSWSTIPECTPDEQESVLKGLSGPQLAVALAQAGFCGDVEIGRRLIEIHGPIETHLEVQEFQAILNGSPLHYAWAEHYLRNAATTADIAEALEWLPQVGLGWMVGVGSDHSLMFDDPSTVKSVLKYISETSFDGVLPSLINGRIEQPELLLALNERSERSAYPDVYQRVLCWVPTHAVGEFPDQLVPYESTQEAYLRDNLKAARPDRINLSRTIPLIDLQPADLAELENHWASSFDPDRLSNGVALQNIILKMSSTDRGRQQERNRLLVHQGNEALQHGFIDRPGMTLCESTVAFLAQFEVGPSDPANAMKCQAYANAYAPFDLIALQYGDKHGDVFLSNPPRYGFELSFDTPKTTYNQLVGLLERAEPFSSQVRNVLSRELMEFLSSLYGDKHAWASTLLTLQREFDIDNQGFAVELTGSDIDLLHAGGYKFAGNTSVVVLDGTRNQSWLYSQQGDVGFNYDSKGMQGLDDEQIHAVQVKATQMGLWLAPSEKPEKIAEVITSISRRKIDSKKPRGSLAWYLANAPIFAAKAYLTVAGPEACALGAKTEKHWHVLKEFFGIEALQPYMKDVSLKIKGSLFTSDLGL